MTTKRSSKKSSKLSQPKDLKIGYEFMWIYSDHGKITHTMCKVECLCSHCLVPAIVALPEVLRAQQLDATTHVCHPGLGGCNMGFEDTSRGGR